MDDSDTAFLRGHDVFVSLLVLMEDDDKLIPRNRHEGLDLKSTASVELSQDHLNKLLSLVVRLTSLRFVSKLGSSFGDTCCPSRSKVCWR